MQDSDEYDKIGDGYDEGKDGDANNDDMNI